MTQTPVDTDDTLANVPPPAGAVRVCEWEDIKCGDPHRYFVGSSLVVYRDDSDEHKDIEVWIDGTQRPDRIERHIVVRVPDARA
jgi:hypothetical protein